MSKTIGIYLIENKISRLVYIGQSIHVERRIRDHKRLLQRPLYKSGVNQRLYRTCKKYGLDSFVFNIIETCHPDKLTIREQYWIDKYRKTHHKFLANAAGPVDNPMTGHRHSKETRDVLSKMKLGKKMSDESNRKKSISSIKMWESQEFRDRHAKSIAEYLSLPETKIKMSNRAKETNGRPEVRLKLSIANKGRKMPAGFSAHMIEVNNLRFSNQENRDAMAETTKNRWKEKEYREKMSKIVIDKETGEKWNSVTECATSIGRDSSSVSQHLHGKTKFCAGRVLSFV